MTQEYIIFYLRSNIKSERKYNILFILYKKFNEILQQNGKITEEDLDNIYSSYKQDMLNAEIYVGRFYSPGNN